MEQNRPATAGNLKVSENVVSTIVKQVISDMDGVSGTDVSAGNSKRSTAVFRSGKAGQDYAEWRCCRNQSGRGFENWLSGKRPWRKKFRIPSKKKFRI